MAEIDILDDPEYKPFRWSFSQWENYNGCPARWKYQSVLKLPRSPAGKHAARGLEMHDRVEKYIIGELPTLVPDPAEVAERCAKNSWNLEDLRPVKINQKYFDVIDSYKDHKCSVRWCEYKLAMDEEWYLCPPTGRLRSLLMVLDVVKAKAGIVEIGEWKSGKPKDTHGDQRKMYAIGGLKAWMADEVRVTTYYLEDTHPPQRLVVKASAYEKLRDLWQGRVEQMKKDQICAPKPSMACRWCDYSRGKGGPCQF